MTAAILCAIAFAGVLLCFAGMVLRKWPFKWLLIFLSGLALLPLPMAIYCEVDHAFVLFLVHFLACWSVLSLITTLVAFSYLESMPFKQPGLEE